MLVDEVIIVVSLTLTLPKSIMKTCSVVLTFESMDEILWCDHSNETSSAVLLQDTTCFSILRKRNLEFYMNFYLWNSWEFYGKKYDIYYSCRIV